MDSENYKSIHDHMHWINGELVEDEPRLPNREDDEQRLHEEEFWSEMQTMVEENGISPEQAAYIMLNYVKRQREIDGNV